MVLFTIFHCKVSMIIRSLIINQSQKYEHVKNKIQIEWNERGGSSYLPSSFCVSSQCTKKYGIHYSLNSLNSPGKYVTLLSLLYNHGN